MQALEEQKSAAIDALHKKAAAVMALHESGKATVEEVDASMGALRDWVDTAEDGKVRGEEEDEHGGVEESGGRGA